MPQENRKEETIRHIEPMNVPRSYTLKSPYYQDFAEVYIENGECKADDEPASQKIIAPPPPPPADEKSEIFSEMKRLANNVGYSGSPYGRLQAILFYEQAQFMENFEDDYGGNAPFSMYYPDYQTMSYEQLRTYFTWRSKVRAGIVQKTSFSYVFVYIYELINNIGVRNSEDGLNKLLFIWNEYRGHESKLDKYMSEWVKDYYLVNDFAVSFEDLLMENEIMRKLFGRSSHESLFDFYCRYSDYKIKQSAFYTPETAKMISECFDQVVSTINQHLGELNVAFDDLVFFSKENEWKPFSKALYYFSTKKAKSKVVYFSKYRCENEFWRLSENKVCTKNGRLVLGYIFKRIEQFLRKSAKFKFKLNADKTKISTAEISRLVPDPDYIFKLVDSAILSYYKQSQIKIITVNTDRLDTIRANALMIQEKLLANAEETEEEKDWPADINEAEGETEWPVSADETAEGTAWPPSAEPDASPPAAPAPPPPAAPAPPPPAASAEDVWVVFVQSLNQTEEAAIQMILRNASMHELHEFSKSCRMMLEVMVDNINQKAIETVRDNILELSEEIIVFEEYKEDLERVMGIECQ